MKVTIPFTCTQLRAYLAIRNEYQIHDDYSMYEYHHETDAQFTFQAYGNNERAWVVVHPDHVTIVPDRDENVTEVFALIEDLTQALIETLKKA